MCRSLYDTKSFTSQFQLITAEVKNSSGQHLNRHWNPNWSAEVGARKVVSLRALGCYQAVVRIAGFGTGILDKKPWFKDENLLQDISPEQVSSVAHSLGFTPTH